MFAPAALDLAARVGLTPVYAKCFTFPTQYVAATRTIYADSDSDLVHDVAHYLVATNAEREMDEFGLGSGPDSHVDGHQDPRVKKAQVKEELASLLGILIERHLGLTIKGKPMHRDTWELHSWDAWGTRIFRKRIKTLQLWGLVRKERGRFIPCL